MASDYGLNFGFRRSDESMAIREGRLRTPKTGTFRMGGLVAFDPANPGVLKAAAAGDVGDGGTAGLLVQEESWNRSIYGAHPANQLDSFALGLAFNDTLSTIWAGAGTKVWFKNSAAQDRADGRSIAAVTMVDLTGADVLDFLTWDGSKFTATGATAANSMLRITAVDLTNGFVEAVLTR